VCFAFAHRHRLVLQRALRQWGADGVGRATTDTVVAIAISVLVLDFFLTKLFLSI